LSEIKVQIIIWQMIIIKNLIKLHSDILHTWISGYLDLLPTGTRNIISPKSLIQKVLKVTKYWIKSFLLIFKSEDKIEKDKVWVFTYTSNNYKALKFLESMDNTIFVAPKLTLKTEDFHQYCKFIHFRRKFFHELLFPFYFLLLFFYDAKKLRNYFDLLHEAFGLTSESLRLIKKYKPRAIVFANDHSIPNRSLLMAARKINTKTIYLQHATVSEYFPPSRFVVKPQEAPAS